VIITLTGGVIFTYNAAMNSYWQAIPRESSDRVIDPPEPRPDEPDWDSIRKAREIDEKHEADKLNEVLEDIGRREPGL